MERLAVWQGRSECDGGGKSGGSATELLWSAATEGRLMSGRPKPSTI
jgi:hypothetical protein